MAMYKTLRELDTKTLLRVHNEATGKTTTRFASRGTGEDQTLRAIRKNCNNDAGIGELWLNEAIARVSKPVDDKPASKPATVVEKPVAVQKDKVTEPVAPRGEEVPAEPKVKRTRKGKGTDIKPYGGPPSACREGSKRAILVDILSRPQGASIDEMIAAMSGGKKPWLPQTVRSGLGWDMREKGYGVKSYKDEEGVERFRLVLPVDSDGNAYPIPAHVPLVTKGDA